MQDKKKSDMWQALSLLGQLGYVIAIPLVIFALGGRLIDKKYGTSPWFLIVGMFFALVISTFWVYKKTAEIMKEAADDKSEARNPKSETNKENSNDQNPKHFEH